MFVDVITIFTQYVFYLIMPLKAIYQSHLLHFFYNQFLLPRDILLDINLLIVSTHADHIHLHTW